MKYMVEMWRGYEYEEREVEDFDQACDLRDEAYKQGGDKVRIVPIVICCETEVYCSDFTNTCDVCGADYNFNGERLASRSQWGQETGERWQDCY